MKSNGISKHFAVILLILLPLAVADGFKDHQIRLGYENGEYRLIKWLNKIRGSDRSVASQPESQFDPIKIEDKISEIQHDTSNFTQTQSFDSPQLAKATYSSVPQSPDDTSSSKSSFASVEAQETRPFLSSMSSPSYRDYLYLKWFHGSPKATYFNEAAAADKHVSILDSKTEHGRNPTEAAIPAIPNSPEETTNQEFDAGSIDFSGAESPLLSSDSVLGKVLGKMKQIMPAKTQQLDYSPLKFYDEPPKPQFTLPIVAHSSHPLPVHNKVQQIPSQAVKEVSLPVVPVQPVHDEVSLTNDQASQEEIIPSTDKSTIQNQSRLEEMYTSQLEQDLSNKEDTKIQSAEPSSTPTSTLSSKQPESKDSISERLFLKPFYNSERPMNIRFQSEEPAYSALELAFSPLVPTYP